MKASLFLAIPCYTKPEPEFTESLERLERALDRCGIAHERRMLQGESLITRARNRLTAAFLASPCTHMLQLDTDLVFEPSDALRLLHSGHDLCAAPYPAKAPGGRLIGNPVMIEGGHHVVRDGFALAQDLPTGFMLTARSIFERLAPHVPEVDDDLPGSKLTYRVFFDAGIDGRQYLSEDWWFTRLARKAGVEAWLDVRARLGHIGRFRFTAPSLEEQWGTSEARPAWVPPSPRPEPMPLDRAPKEVVVDGVICPPDMASHVKEVLDGCYDAPGMEFDNPPHVLDIGANVGAFTVWAKRRWPGATVDAYEPNPNAIRWFERNRKGEVLHFVAVRVMPGVGSLMFGKNNLGEASFYDLGEQTPNHSLGVKCISTSSLPPCDVMKVDTEGCEVEIIKGYIRSTAYLPKVVAYEYHRETDYSELLYFLPPFGYECIKHTSSRPDRGVCVWVWVKP